MKEQSHLTTGLIASGIGLVVVILQLLKIAGILIILQGMNAFLGLVIGFILIVLGGYNLYVHFKNKRT
jgi:hypothetical protein